MMNIKIANISFFFFLSKTRSLSWKSLFDLDDTEILPVDRFHTNLLKAVKTIVNLVVSFVYWLTCDWNIFIPGNFSHWFSFEWMMIIGWIWHGTKHFHARWKAISYNNLYKCFLSHLWKSLPVFIKKKRNSFSLLNIFCFSYSVMLNNSLCHSGFSCLVCSEDLSKIIQLLEAILLEDF